MASKAWEAHPITDAAIDRLEGQFPKGTLEVYGTDEHLALIRYGILDGCCTKTKEQVPKIDPKDGKPVVENGEIVTIEGDVFTLNPDKLKEWFAKESAFLGYASNAKKMLIEGKRMDKPSEKPNRGYE